MSASATDDDTLAINLTVTASPATPRIPLKLAKSATPSALRQQASEATRIPISSLRLIFRGRMIQQDDSKVAVDEYKLEQDCVLHCMGKPVEKNEEVETTTVPTGAAQAKPAAAGSTVSMVAPSTLTLPHTTTVPSSLPQALATLRSSNASSVYLTAVTTLQKILTNIIQNPLEEKYRKVKQSNAAFSKRLGGLTGGLPCMVACGFLQDDSSGEACLVLAASPEAWNQLLETKRVVDAAVVEAKQMIATSGRTSAPPMPGSGLPTEMPMGVPPPLMGGGGGPMMGGMPPMTPQMQQAATQMMSNPAAMQQMLQDPNTRRMLESDPRFANNPMLRQSIDAMASNPQMLQQVSQMMQDPSMQNRMQQMMGSGGMPSAPGTTPMAGAPTPAAGNSTTTTSGTNAPRSNNGDNGQEDQEMTEEEMLEEAIRRSLQEG